MNALETGDQLNPKFYKNISPNFCEMLINFRKTHPIKLISFGNKKIEYISCGSGRKTILLFHGALGNAEGNFKDILKKICEIVDGPISAEITALDADGMVAEAKELCKIHKNIAVPRGPPWGAPRRA